MFRRHERTGRVLGDEDFQKQLEKNLGRVLRRQNRSQTSRNPFVTYGVPGIPSRLSTSCGQYFQLRRRPCDRAQFRFNKFQQYVLVRKCPLPAANTVEYKHNTMYSSSRIQHDFPT